MKIRLVISTLALMVMTTMTQAKIKTEEVTYEVDGEAFTGYIAYDDKKGKKPGVLIVHEWWGHNDYARKRAEMLAEEGYVAFALDMYGSGKLADHPDNAKAFMMSVFNNLPAGEKRFNKAYEILNSHKQTENDSISAIGYCFGGAIVLHMARTGAPLKSVVSFHGSLGSNLAEGTAPDIKGKVQVYTGGKDPMIPAEQVSGFATEMFNAGADYSITVYKDAMHSFTNPGATEKGKKLEMPLAYNKEADEDSWQGMLDLFKDIYEK